jgi:aspartyl-tRNA(Asn)/glutamyl-tRNA(Gln) amidotransferase subunit B
LEIVSEPQIHSAPEAKAYARELYLLMKYADVSDVDLYHGNLRFDVNISVSQNPAKPGKRAEIKNLNSFRSVENAVEYEIERQIELYEKGQEVVQETRGWDEAKQRTTSQRGKEEAQDYRYMPEPDIPPVELDEKFIERIRKDLPATPFTIREKLSSIGLNSNEIETMLDDPETTLSFIEEGLDVTKPKESKVIGSTFIHDAKIREAFRAMQAQMKKDMLRSAMHAATATVSGQINSSQYTETIHQIFLENKNIEDIQFEQITDESEIEKIVTEVLDQNPQAAQDVQNGEMKAIGFLVGQVMAKSQGKANPQIANEILRRQLGLE